MSIKLWLPNKLVKFKRRRYHLMQKGSLINQKVESEAVEKSSVKYSKKVLFYLFYLAYT